MKINEFLAEINMLPEAVHLLNELQESGRIGEEEYQENKLLYEKDRALFYEKILLEKDYRLVFLYYLCRMGAETYDAYEKRGIDEYDWFFRHMKLTIFRLGRMQFEIMDSRWNFTAGERMVKKGDPIISIHIPQGEKLTLESVKESIVQGMAFWGKEMPYLCHSWLLYPGLKDILPEKSNIIMFQNQFQIVETDWDEREAEWRIWGKVQRNLNVYSENTSLQRAAKKYLKSGKVLGSGLGILKPEYFL